MGDTFSKELPRHVIFLGAGASYTSGYPVGDSLRLRLSCRKRFETELRSAIGETMDNSVEACCRKHFETFGSAIKLFRNGGFSTVDEFSKLVAKSQPNQTQDMKKLMRSALAFHNAQGRRRPP